MELPFPEPSYLPCLAFLSQVWQPCRDKIANEDTEFKCQCRQKKKMHLIIIQILVATPTALIL